MPLLPFDEEKYATINQAAELLDLSRQWVRRMIKQGKLVGVRHEDGRWLIERSSIETKHEWLERKYAAQDARRKQGKGPSAYYLPPSLKAIAMVRGKVLADRELSGNMRDMFLTALDIYEQDFERELERIRNRRAAVPTVTTKEKGEPT